MNDSTALIVRSPDRWDVWNINDAATELKEIALATGALVGKVENAADNESAVKAQIELKRVSTLFEKSRKAAKEPLLEAGRALDRLIASELQPLAEEIRRISELTSGFQEKEREREERKREERRARDDLKDLLAKHR